MLVISILNSEAEIKNKLEMTLGLKTNFSIIVTHLDAKPKMKNKQIKLI